MLSYCTEQSFAWVLEMKIISDEDEESVVGDENDDYGDDDDN